MWFLWNIACLWNDVVDYRLTCMWAFSRSHGTYRLLNAVGPFQCCITIEFRLSSDIDDIITALELLWFDFLAISSLLLFFNDLPIAHSRFRNKNDDTINTDATIMPPAIIAIGKMVFNVERGNTVFSLSVPFPPLPNVDLLSIVVPLASCVPSGRSVFASLAFVVVSFILVDCWSVGLLPLLGVGAGSG